MKSYVIHKDWNNSVLNLFKAGVLSCEEVGDLFIGISEYQLNGIVKTSSQKALLVLMPLIEQFKRDEEKYQKKVERNRENGKSGGRPIKEEIEEKPAVVKPIRKPPPKIVTQFDDFYQAYPRKIGKQTALKAYDRALKSTTHDAIMQGVLKYKNDIASKKTTPEYIKHPSSWLNAGCWDDDYTTVVVTAQKPADYYDTSKNKYFIERD
ncbi:hypothetical protein UFOVP338_58 [uncultured Caudovirales phage]|uniref:DUF6291 domain-containing protein n=1 Tax=uncultured Caudovirales phage TaxID=2100421 RepID=A0A6J5M6W6_9CAUD|nr:hypothetical protein UFOVP338_58 [uncultured Caudovirales phage]